MKKLKKHYHSKIMMTKEQARAKLHEMWEGGLTPSNFTEDHSQYDEALWLLMNTGYLPKDFF